VLMALEPTLRCTSIWVSFGTHMVWKSIEQGR
jgi:hypothetical protein